MNNFALRTMIAAVLIVAVAGPAAGAEATSKPVPSDSEKMPVAKAADLLNALNLLGGHEVVVGQGASQRVATLPYDLSADTLWAISDDITVLRKVVLTYQETVKSTTAVAEAKNGGPLKADSPEQKALAEAIQKLFDSERSFPRLFRITRADLKLGENRIPPAVVSSLAPILNP